MMSSTLMTPSALQVESGLAQQVLQLPELALQKGVGQSFTVQLMRLDEINEGQPQAYRQALANVYATLSTEEPTRLLYLLEGDGGKVSLYMGAAVAPQGGREGDAHEAIKELRSALEGQLPGINFGEDVNPQECDELLQRAAGAKRCGVMLGVPTLSAADTGGDGAQNFQSVDRLVHALQSGKRSEGTWQLLIVSEPLARTQVRHLLDDMMVLSSRLAAQARASLQTSVNVSQQKGAAVGTSNASGTNNSLSHTRGRSENGSEARSSGTSSSSGSSSSSSGTNAGTTSTKSVGTSENQSSSEGSSHSTTHTENASLSDTHGHTVGVTQDLANKRAQHLMEHIDKQLIPRLEKGLAKGLFFTAVYLMAENRSLYNRLKRNACSIFQGVEASLSPLEIYDFPESGQRGMHQSPMHPEAGFPAISSTLAPETLLFHSLYTRRQEFGSLLTAEELATVAGFPQHELQGIRRRKMVDFIVDLPEVKGADSLNLGNVLDMGRKYPNNPVCLARADLSKHLFVTGVTGAGKTTTCLKLLQESGMNFLVIEPAKTEYRELASRMGSEIAYYRPNGDEHQSLRINPFAMTHSGQRIQSHIGFLCNVFAAVFPLEGSMPAMLEAAMQRAYEERGWDVHENELMREGDPDPLDPLTGAWPTLSDMIRHLDQIIPTYGLGREFEEKYRGSLVSRLRSLTDGALGRVLDVPQSLDFCELLKRRAVIELEEVQNESDKALLMALVLGNVNEAVRNNHRHNPRFRHLTLIEEAHRLLSRPAPGDTAATMAVEAFANMLAEVRKYGAGLIIADQIPAKLIPDVIKNTHTKIVHRLFAEDDRRAMGETMMMNDDQRNFLPNLRTGEAIVFCGGWHGPAHAEIKSGAVSAVRPALAQAQVPASVQEDPSRCYEKQLWQERARYYPNFCKEAWLSREGDDRAMFASFVAETRKAQNRLLDLLKGDSIGATSVSSAEANRALNALHHLKKWATDWSARIPADADTDAEGSRGAHAQASVEGEPLPLTVPDTLVRAWCALLRDANPTPRVDRKSLSLLQNEELSHLREATHGLMQLWSTSPDLKSLFSQLHTSPALREAKIHCTKLAQFTRI